MMLLLLFDVFCEDLTVLRAVGESAVTILLIGKTRENATVLYPVG